MSLFDLFSLRTKQEAKEEQQLALPLAGVEIADEASEGAKLEVRSRSARTAYYGVRVREGFKSEFKELLAEMQAERAAAYGQSRRMTEGELIELVVETFKSAHRAGAMPPGAVPLRREVWQAVYRLAEHLQLDPGEVIEQLVTHKAIEVGVVRTK